MPLRVTRLALIACGVAALVALPAVGPGLPQQAVPATTADAATAVTQRVVLPESRTYFLATPATMTGTEHGDAGEGLPLVIALHGRTDRAEKFVQHTGLIGLVTSGQAVLAAPETEPGLRIRSWNAGSCCDDARDRDIDDVGFIADVIRDAVSRTGASPNTVYLVGFSNGAMLGYRLACERPELIDALVAVGGQRMVDDCPISPVPLLVIHGERDPWLPPAGQQWSTLLETRLPPIHESIAPFVNSEVVLLPTTGHHWPSTAAGDEVDATSLAWRWLSTEASGPPQPPSR